MFRSILLTLAALCLTTACGAPDLDSTALQRLTITHPGADGAPAFRVEAHFLGAERSADVAALLDTLEVVALDDELQGERPADPDRALRHLVEDGGDGLLIRVHPLRPEDQGRLYGYALHLVNQTAAPTEAAGDVETQRQALGLSNGRINVHDLWCHGLRVRYRVNRGEALITLYGPIGAFPLPQFPQGQWTTLKFFAPFPWPSPWMVMVTNMGDGWMDYDMSLTCAL
ncbi:MAG: hypothetical protein KC613_04800 [Myxococcales bacterium]|nr:hypothetical protein [Myxococcales bacterium]MCB9525388.1 hypothetical protein [Myxococcales bacterium]